MDIESTWILYVGMIDSLQLKCLVILTLILFFLSCVHARRTGKYQFIHLTNTLDNCVIPFYGGLSVIGVIAIAQPEWASFLPALWGGLNLMVFGLIAVKLRALGLQIPSLPWVGTK